MRTTGHWFAWVLIFALGLGSTVLAGDEKEEEKVDSRLAVFRSLEGTWVNRENPDQVLFTYEVTAGGSAVAETVRPDTEHEMMTIYHMDGPDFVLTHYCAVGNQPHMVAGKLTDGTLEFVCDGEVGNLDSHDGGHMHRAKYTFVGEDELTAAWTFRRNGKEGRPIVMHAVRRGEE